MEARLSQTVLRQLRAIQGPLQREWTDQREASPLKTILILHSCGARTAKGSASNEEARYF